MVFWSKEGWRVADITLFVKVGETSVRNINQNNDQNVNTNQLIEQTAEYRLGHEKSWKAKAASE